MARRPLDYWLLLSILGLFLVCTKAETTPEGPTTTPEPPITWFDCPDQYSYHPDTTNCTQYLICVFGKAYLRACEGGLNWNDQLKICDWPNPRTLCQQVDDNTAYRPEASPIFTPPPMPADDADDYQPQTQGKYRGSQSLSKYRPDEDAAKDQLSSFAGKKVVYNDAPKDYRPDSGDQMSNSDRSNDGNLNEQPSTNNFDAQRPAPKRKNTGPQLMPIGQLHGYDSSRASGKGQGMSQWDTENDDFPGPPDSSQPDQSASQYPSSQISNPAPNRPKVPMNTPTTSTGGNPPPWAAMALQKKRGGGASPPQSYADDSSEQGAPPPPPTRNRASQGPPRSMPPHPRANSKSDNARSQQRPPSQRRPSQATNNQKGPSSDGQDYQPPGRRPSKPDWADQQADRPVVSQSYSPDADSEASNNPSQSAYVAPPQQPPPPQTARFSGEKSVSTGRAPSGGPRPYSGNQPVNQKPRTPPPGEPQPQRSGSGRYPSTNTDFDGDSNPRPMPARPPPSRSPPRNKDSDSDNTVNTRQSDRPGPRPQSFQSNRDNNEDDGRPTTKISNKAPFGIPQRASNVRTMNTDSDDDGPAPRGPGRGSENDPPNIGPQNNLGPSHAAPDFSSLMRSNSGQSQNRPSVNRRPSWADNSQDSGGTENGASGEGSRFMGSPPRTVQSSSSFGGSNRAPGGSRTSSGEDNGQSDDDSGPPRSQQFGPPSASGDSDRSDGDIPKRIWSFGSSRSDGPPNFVHRFDSASTNDNSDQTAPSEFEEMRFKRFYDGV